MFVWISLVVTSVAVLASLWIARDFWRDPRGSKTVGAALAVWSIAHEAMPILALHTGHLAPAIVALVLALLELALVPTVFSAMGQ